MCVREREKECVCERERERVCAPVFHTDDDDEDDNGTVWTVGC